MLAQQIRPGVGGVEADIQRERTRIHLQRDKHTCSYKHPDFSKDYSLISTLSATDKSAFVSEWLMWCINSFRGDC